MTLKHTFFLIASTGLSAALLTGCLRTTHEIKPIHITMDVNLKIDKHLDDFFAKPVEPLISDEEQKRTDREKMRIQFAQRKPVINEWKAEGVIGETASGYIAFIVENSDEAIRELVEEENTDRERVYTAIAKKESTTPELVGKLRAERIAHHAQTGDFLMNADGEWIQVE